MERGEEVLANLFHVFSDIILTQNLQHARNISSGLEPKVSFCFLFFHVSNVNFSQMEKQKKDPYKKFSGVPSNPEENNDFVVRIPVWMVFTLIPIFGAVLLFGILAILVLGIVVGSVGFGVGLIFSKGKIGVKIMSIVRGKHEGFEDLDKSLESRKL